MKIDEMTKKELRHEFLRLLSAMAFADGFLEGLGKKSDYVTQGYLRACKLIEGNDLATPDPKTQTRRVICLTGQQWLKRFKEQCDILEPNTPDQYWKAARIAACLEDDENA